MTKQLTDILKGGIKASNELTTLLENEKKRIDLIKEADSKQCDIHVVVNRRELLRRQEQWLIENTSLSGRTIDDFIECFKQ